jgi:hypothetical protein
MRQHVSHSVAFELHMRLQYSGQKFNSVVSFYSSQPPLHPYITCVLVGPPTYIYLFCFNSFLKSFFFFQLHPPLIFSIRFQSFFLN